MMAMLYAFIVSLLLAPLARAEAVGSVFFVDVSSNQYLRIQSSDHVAESNQLSLTEVASAISVLLGLAPPASLTADGSSKLNAILKPNPFDKPRHVLMLELTGTSDLDSKHALLSNALTRTISPYSDTADIQLTDEGEVLVISLHQDSVDSNDEDLNDLAYRLGGSYAANPLKQITGLLSIPLENGVNMNLKMEKKADRQFALSLVALLQNVRKAFHVHQDTVESMRSLPELMIGSFDGIQALQEEYGAGVAKQGLEVVLVTFSKMFDSLEKLYKGQLVGVILCTPESQSTIKDFMYAPRPYPRLLAETKGSSNETTLVEEVLLVRRTLAWLTGVILLIATLLGIYFLLYMPITKDTLLYSNVKLD